MTDETLSAIMVQIVTHPDEELHRLVYADRLDELGAHERAAFIRLDVIQARTGRPFHPDWDADEDRVYAIVKANGKEWAPVLPAFEVPLCTNPAQPNPARLIWNKTYGRWITGWIGASGQWMAGGGVDACFRGGFVGELRCSTGFFLYYVDDLIWHESQPEPRSCPSTVQPVREVHLTDIPVHINGFKLISSGCYANARWPGVNFTCSYKFM